MSKEFRPLEDFVENSATKFRTLLRNSRNSEKFDWKAYTQLLKQFDVDQEDHWELLKGHFQCQIYFKDGSVYSCRIRNGKAYAEFAVA